MVGNMIRVLRARRTLSAVDEAGMSTVEYCIVRDYNYLVGFRPVPLLADSIIRSRRSGSLVFASSVVG